MAVGVAYPRSRVAYGQLTLAQINANTRAGTTIVPGSSGRTITVVDCWFRSAAGGTAGGCTAVILTDTTPTTINSVTAATLTLNALVRGGASGSTVTNFGTAMAAGAGLRIGCTVADLTTMTAMDYCVHYVIS